MPLTGLQRQVFSLYRAVLRAARSKPADQQAVLQQLARREFERYRGVGTRDIQLIEHLLRKGRRQLDVVSRSEVTGLTLH